MKSRIGLGCVGMTQSYGIPLDKAEAIRLLCAAVERGVASFDTVDTVDTAEDDGPFNSEALVGEALASVRDRVLIATRFG